MVDACVTHGIFPYYGPFGDIKDTVACEDQFRNAYLLGCVGAWSLHPVQIEIAKRVFSPRRPTSRTRGGSSRRWATAPARSCSTARWRTTPRVKQCQVIVELAEQLADRRPASWPQAYAVRRREGRRAMSRLRPRRSVLYMPGANERALEKAKTPRRPTR